jgi:hypothetical protein
MILAAFGEVEEIYISGSIDHPHSPVMIYHMSYDTYT